MRQAVIPILAMSLIYPSVQAACTADSGNQRQHLLELYTSEGCSSCPPADRFLSGIKHEKAIVPLAFHVDYWDRLGWSDRFANAEFSRRQETLARQNGSGFSYTPQFVLDGRDWRASGDRAPWQEQGVQPADRLRLQADRQGKEQLAIAGTWRGKSGQVYVAIYENSLESKVVAGENSGRRLHHDFVVRELIGPLAVANGVFRHSLSLDPGWKPVDLGVVAFVTEKMDQTKVLQALQLPLCAL